MAVDAENGEYLAIFDKKCVDAVLGMEAETEAVTDSVTLTDIVSDVAVNGVDSTYKGQTVTISAVPWINYSNIKPASLRFNAVGIHTHSDSVALIVQMTHTVIFAR